MTTKITEMIAIADDKEYLKATVKNNFITYTADFLDGMWALGLNTLTR